MLRREWARKNRFKNEEIYALQYGHAQVLGMWSLSGFKLEATPKSNLRDEWNLNAADFRLDR
jgi:hypothetical protein